MAANEIAAELKEFYELQGVVNDYLYKNTSSEANLWCGDIKEFSLYPREVRYSVLPLAMRETQDSTKMDPSSKLGSDALDEDRNVDSDVVAMALFPPAASILAYLDAYRNRNVQIEFRSPILPQIR